MKQVRLSHGRGGVESYQLINDLFLSYFHNDTLCKQNDAGLVEPIDGKIAISTDSFVINPLFFPGGDIGKLSVCGTVGDHGACIMSKREGLNFKTQLESDCAPLHELTDNLLKVSSKIRKMRDPTRGGLATTLNELILNTPYSMMIHEKNVPIKEEVKNFCDLIGLDPLYVANEGKLICIVAKEDCDKVLRTIKNHPLGQDAQVIGEIIENPSNKVYVKTLLGATKLLPMATGELLPRIC